MHKTVHHFLLLATDPVHGLELSDADVEVSEVAWVPLDELAARLAYADERAAARAGARPARRDGLTPRRVSPPAARAPPVARLQPLAVLVARSWSRRRRPPSGHRRPVDGRPPSPRADVCAGASRRRSRSRSRSRRCCRARRARPEEPFQVAGRLRNCGQEPVSTLELRLSVGGRLASRGALQRADEEPVLGASRLTEQLDVEELAPGATTRFDLRLLVGDLRPGPARRLPAVGAGARRSYGDDRDGTPVGLASTFVPWFPDGTPAPTRVAWLWPLVDQPRRAPSEVMLDDELPELLGDGEGAGRRAGCRSSWSPVARARGAAATRPRARPRATCPRRPSPPLTRRRPRRPSRRAAARPCRSPGPSTRRCSTAAEALDPALDRPHRPRGWSSSRPRRPPPRGWPGCGRRLRAARCWRCPSATPTSWRWPAGTAGWAPRPSSCAASGSPRPRGCSTSSRSQHVAWPPPGPLPRRARRGGRPADRRPSCSTSRRCRPPRPPATARRARRTDLSSVTGPVSGLVVEDVLSRLVEQPSGGSRQPAAGRAALDRRDRDHRRRAAQRLPHARGRSRPPRRRRARRRRRRSSPTPAGCRGCARCRWPTSPPAPSGAPELPDEQRPGAGRRSCGRRRSRRTAPTSCSDAFLARLERGTTAADQFTESVLVSGTEAGRRAPRPGCCARPAAPRPAPGATRRCRATGCSRLLQQDVADLRGRCAWSASR